MVVEIIVANIFSFPTQQESKDFVKYRESYDLNIVSQKQGDCSELGAGAVRPQGCPSRPRLAKPEIYRQLAGPRLCPSLAPSIPTLAPARLGLTPSHMILKSPMTFITPFLDLCTSYNLLEV